MRDHVRAATAGQIFGRLRFAWLGVALAAILCAAPATERANAATCPNDAIRQQQGSTHLPDCRGYEMVSPADKNGGSVLWGAGGLQTGGVFLATADGGKVAYSSYQPFPQSQNGIGPQPYLSSRTASGWETIATGPTPQIDIPTTVHRVNVMDATDDFSTSIYETGAPLNPLDQDTLELPGLTFAFSDVYKQDGDGPVEFISRFNEDVPATAFAFAIYAGRSDDASRVVFATTESLVPEATPMAESSRFLYVRGPAGTELVNADENGDLISQCGASLGDSWYGGKAIKNAVSGDGERIFFQAPDQEAKTSPEPSCSVPAQLYLREGGKVTNVSASQMTVPDPVVSRATFQAAAANGSRVFFTSEDRLTDDATVGGGLYAYDVGSKELSFLSSGADGPGGAEVQGVVRSSDDGSHVYFIAKGQLDGSNGTAGQPNLYLWTPGSVRFVATVADADVPAGYGLLGAEETRPARVSTDGSRLLFLSRANQTDYEAEGTVQAYLWSEESGTMLCASCGASDSPRSANVALRSREGGNGRAEYNHASRNLLDDGRVLFETTTALARRDVNGAIDVYEYEPGSGVQNLITDGKARFGSFFFDASADGSDIFFATQASLVAEDVDNGENDIYDARVDGGFAPPPAPPSCAGEACQGPLPSGPAAADVGSATMGQIGSKPNRKGRLGSQRKGKGLLGSPSKRVGAAAVTVTARVGGAGTLSARGPGLSVARKSVKKAGAYALKLSLDRGAQARLQAKGQLGIRIEVRFAPTEGSVVTRSLFAKFVADCEQKCTNADGRVQG